MTSTTVELRRVPLPLFSKALTDSWRSLIGWMIGLAAVISLYLPLYPSIGGNAQMKGLISSLPPELTKAIGYDDIASGAGYVQATIFGLLGFLLVSIAAISWGAAAIGGDEEAGQLELTLAHGVTRMQIVLERYAAMALRIVILGAWVFALIALFNGPAETTLDVAKLAGSSALFTGLGLLTGSAALMAGAISGRRIWGIGVGAFVPVIGYVFNAVGNQSKDLEWLHALSPISWAYADKPLINGANGWALLALYGISLVMAAVSVMALRRRDVGV
ncbi:ABC transporter permease subunit [Psychromicrobium sp. YIM B11713]|uniref:ABC transporter permease subunit n=1 Tax=Psychromicrobium sp. YIM B11713 TaxID=3145233 RepID=UPI00374F51BD